MGCWVCPCGQATRATAPSLTLSLYAAGLFVADRFRVPPDRQVELSALLILLLATIGLLALTVRGRDSRRLLSHGT